MFRAYSRLLALLLVLVAPLAQSAEDKGSTYISYIELKPFVTNFGTADDMHFLKAEVTLQVDSEAAHHAVNAHKAQIRNDLVFLFSAQTEESVGTVAAQQLLSGEALKLVQDMLMEEEGETYVADLFFTSLVVQ
ncbi:flagellar basal body-associated FliL family protein [Marinobacterium sp. YM272]|uniref:flagellar basal body-associated FliL family protein n=1 Tax=Marinobacterium sp. YM272 TaxID=3421654 RepID=UPI003D7FD6CB